jgi:hypothetical protein
MTAGGLCEAARGAVPRRRDQRRSAFASHAPELTTRSCHIRSSRIAPSACHACSGHRVAAAHAARDRALGSACRTPHGHGPRPPGDAGALYRHAARQRRGFGRCHPARAAARRPAGGRPPCRRAGATPRAASASAQDAGHTASASERRTRPSLSNRNLRACAASLSQPKPGFLSARLIRSAKVLAGTGHVGRWLRLSRCVAAAPWPAIGRSSTSPAIKRHGP